MSMDIHKAYEMACKTESDVYEHLPTLYEYAKKSKTVIECGMRTCNSTWAILAGLLDGNEQLDRSVKYVGCDVEDNAYVRVAEALAKKEGIDFRFLHGDDLTFDYPQADFIFLDTWHVYGQLKRELAKFHKLAPIIALHDTTVDEWVSESVRMEWPLQSAAMERGWKMKEVTVGLWPAVEGFLAAHPEWEIRERFTNCNGLTVLARNETAWIERSTIPGDTFLQVREHGLEPAAPICC
jgi:hypothetical protein